MFAKLLKYEWRATAHTLLPLYLLVIAAAVLNALIGRLRGLTEKSVLAAAGAVSGDFASFVQFIIMGLCFTLMVALFVVTYVVAIQRFYKGIVGDEGYLIMTAPVETWEIPAAKCLMSVIFGILAFLVALITIVIMVGPTDVMRALIDFHWVEAIKRLYEMTPFWPLYMLEGIVVMLLSGAAGMYQIYLAIMLGQISNTHKLAFSFLWYIGISTIMQFVAWIIMTLTGFGMSLWFTGPMGFAMNAGLGADAGIQYFLHSSLLLSVIELVLFCIGTQYLMKHKLNI